MAMKGKNSSDVVGLIAESFSSRVPSDLPIGSMLPKSNSKVTAVNIIMQMKWILLIVPLKL